MILAAAFEQPPSHLNYPGPFLRADEVKVSTDERQDLEDWNFRQQHDQGKRVSKILQKARAWGTVRRLGYLERPLARYVSVGLLLIGPGSSEER